jgi:hypothetical protein
MPPTKFSNQTPESLERIAHELERLADTVRLLKTDMELFEIESMQVGSYTSLTRGMDYLESFVMAARRAAKKVREERGDFRGDTE